MSQAYSPKDIEKKWQDIWDEEKAFRAGEDYSKPKYYALVEYKAIMYYILWDGTLSACRRRIMRLKIRSIQRL